uniref:Epstein-Barr virus induced 3 n=1 Tax=Sus scrofa TaxID=9823 RepID=A0A8D0KDK3_PIG
TGIFCVGACVSPPLLLSQSLSSLLFLFLTVIIPLPRVPPPCCSRKEGPAWKGHRVTTSPFRDSSPCPHLWGLLHPSLGWLVKGLGAPPLSLPGSSGPTNQAVSQKGKGKWGASTGGWAFRWVGPKSPASLRVLPAPAPESRAGQSHGCETCPGPCPYPLGEQPALPWERRLGMAAHGESRPCLQPSPEATSCTIPDVLMFSMVPYVLNVTAIHPQGSSSSLVPFVPEHIIKPDPPEGVRQSPLPGQQLWVQWKPPRSWPFPEIFSLKYWIRYKRHGASRFRQVGPIETTSFTLKAGRPKARYCIQVAAQDLTDYGEPSAWSLPAADSVTLGK